MLEPKTKRGAPKGGYSIRKLAAVLDLPEKRVRRAVDLNHIKAVDFGGVVRIPPSEVERLRELYK